MIIDEFTILNPIDVTPSKFKRNGETVFWAVSDSACVWDVQKWET